MATLRVFVVLVLFILNIHHSHSEKSTCPSENEQPMFIFGDSLYDSGNNNYIPTSPIFQGNFPPYGETFFNYPTGRLSDGRLITDFIADYAELSHISRLFLDPRRLNSYTNGVNFASAGAGALPETNPGLVINLRTQGLYFTRVSKQLRQQFGEHKAKRLLSTAVYLFSIASNDYASPFIKNPMNVTLPYSPEKFVDFVIGNITTVIKGIYNEGGRKFAFLNVAPLSCAPLLRTFVNGTTVEACLQAQPSALARLHNIVLSRSFQNLEKQLSGFKYSIFNFYDAILELVKYPSKYGFREGSVACCGGGPYRGDYSCGGKRGIEEFELCSDPGENVFFDSLHPSEKAAEHFAQLMWNGNRDVIESYNLKQLFNF
ncbi:GDSL esterase/lipase [Vigna angularis]|uniref:GDSL esterase/lipase n=1 Tax=Phaseolus angularis TaxID=3914 RepID=A0A8T0JS72_PHAAN|nr:GDSL esterase/lipase [Vigna angularis]